MYKKEPLESLFSEIYISKLGKLLGCNMVDYNRYNQNIIYCKDFTNGASINFEDAQGLIPENKEIDFLYNFKVFHNINPTIAKDYADMLYLDAVCMNVDRHIHNYGVLRNVEDVYKRQLWYKSWTKKRNIIPVRNGSCKKAVKQLMLSIGILSSCKM